MKPKFVRQHTSTTYFVTKISYILFPNDNVCLIMQAFLLLYIMSIDIHCFKIYRNNSKGKIIITKIEVNFSCALLLFNKLLHVNKPLYYCKCQGRNWLVRVTVNRIENVTVLIVCVPFMKFLFFLQWKHDFRQS